MIQRSTCMYNGQTIGIESIYTVVNGQQINIPDKLESLRLKSRNNELFCPCGCGANLILVASDRNLKQQHFRIKDPICEKSCEYVSEGLTSISSKIILKCWLEDKLNRTEIETRVPICALEDSNRKYEMSLLSRERKIAVSYCHKRQNLSDEKLSIIDENSSGIRTHYIVDIENTGIELQYPEMMIKTQKRQGYCLYLKVSFNEKMEAQYSDSVLTVCFLYNNPDGYWQEIQVLSDFLSAFSFDEAGSLMYSSTTVYSTVETKKVQFLKELEENKRNWEKQQAEQHAALARREEQSRQAREYCELLRREAEQHRLAKIAAIELTEREYTKGKIDAIIDDNQEEPFYDPLGRRWVRCEYCGIVAVDSEFADCGGKHHARLGKCKNCSTKPGISILPEYQKKPEIVHIHPFREQFDTICPRCGGKLRERTGAYGSFFGCSNYPICRYTRSK